ncbi:hypothetical protein IF650_00605 [Cellulosimicrobium terreum]|nr:hypothetical protein [Cellulosimicrobium terreum]
MPLRHLVRSACAVVVAASLAVPASAVANPLTTTASAVAADQATALPAIEHVETTSGQEAYFAPEPPLYGTRAWEYSADGGTTWAVLAGKTSGYLTITAVTARDGWQVRQRATSGGTTTYSAPAWLRVHSTVKDPFPQSSAGTAFALTSGWAVAARSGSTTSTGVLGRVRLTKVDRTATVSDLQVSYRDSSGTWTPGTIRKDRVAGAVVDVTVSSKTSAATRAARTGDVWKIVDTVTGETEYFAATTDRPAMRQPALEVPRPLLAAQIGEGLLQTTGGYARAGDLMRFETRNHRRLGDASVRWELRPRHEYGETWQDLGRTGTSTTLRASSARDGASLRAVIRSNGYVQYQPVSLQIRSTLADPYALDPQHGITLQLAWSTTHRQYPTWTVVPRSSTYDRAAGTATLRGTFTPTWTDVKNLRVYHREANGTWTMASIRATQGEWGQPFAFTATARPGSAALASTAGDVWRIHDATVSSSVEFLRTG